MDVVLKEYSSDYLAPIKKMTVEPGANLHILAVNNSIIIEDKTKTPRQTTGNNLK